MKGNPHCPACGGTGRAYNQRPQDREPEWRDCDMLPLPGGETVNAAVAEDMRRMVEDIAFAQPEDELVEIIAAQMWLDTFGPDSRRDWHGCVREAEEYGPESAAAMQVYQWRARAKRFAGAIRPWLTRAAPAPSRPAGDLAGLSERAVEAVARAICHARQPNKDPDTVTPFQRGRLGQGPHWQVFYEQAAIAAIHALGEIGMPLFGGALTPAAPRPAPTEEEIAKTIAGFVKSHSLPNGRWLNIIDGSPSQVARAVVALFRDADRGAGEGAR